MVFREHGVLIYLSKDLYSGWIKLQADRNLGRTYAGLLPFVEGLYHLGYISEAVYNEHVKKYSVPLDAKEPSVEETTEKRILNSKLSKVDATLKACLEQWDIHPAEWQIQTIAYAKKYPSLESAKLIIAKEGSP